MEAAAYGTHRIDTRLLIPAKKATAGQNAPEVKSSVARFQSAFVIPKWPMQETEQQYDMMKWPELYRFAEDAMGKVSKLIVRLSCLAMIYLRDGDKTIYRREGEWSGQQKLF